MAAKKTTTPKPKTADEIVPKDGAASMSYDELLTVLTEKGVQVVETYIVTVKDGVHKSKLMKVLALND